MTDMPAVTRLWLHTYTRGLPLDQRDRRCEELASDVYEQLADGGAAGRRARTSVVGRTARGAMDDLAWRREQRHRMDSNVAPHGLRAAWAAMTQAWFAPAAALIVAFDIVLAVGILLDENSTMPGRVVGPLVTLALGLCMATGLLLRSQARWRPASALPGVAPTNRNAAVTVLLVLAAVAAVVGTSAGRAPLLLALLLLLLAGTLFALGRRRAGRGRAGSAVADPLIMLGTLPGLAFFWMVVPAVLALVVIAGVLSTGPDTRRPAVTV